MKKQSELPERAETQASHTFGSHGRSRLSVRERSIVASLFAAFLFLTFFWEYLPYPTLEKSKYAHKCHRLTVEQRASKILDQNPLIGQLIARPHCTCPMLNWPRRWTQ